MRNPSIAFFASVAAIVAVSCGESPSDDSLPAGPRMLAEAAGGLDVKHFGYIADVRYEAAVSPGDLQDSDTVEAAMPPADAVALAKPALSVVGANPGDFVECGVDLVLHAHRSSYYYLVSFCSADDPASIGFRVPVTFSGEIVQPILSENQP